MILNTIASASGQFGAVMTCMVRVRELWRRRLARRMIALVVSGSALGSTFGCGGDTTAPASATFDKTFWALQLNYRAVNMSTVASFNTVRLEATAINIAGAPLVVPGPVTYRSLDSAVIVDSTGLVTARFVTDEGAWARVVASLRDFAGNLTHVDTARIRVTDTVPHTPLNTLSLHPAAGDSAKRSFDDDGYWLGRTAGRQFAWPARAADRAGHTLCDTTTCPLLVDYRSADPTVATIDRTIGLVTAQGIGHTLLTATTWAYGVTMRDSVLFTIGNKLLYSIPIALSSQSGVTTAAFGGSPNVTLGIGAVVAFVCLPTATPPCDRPVDVKFDRQTAVDTASGHFGGITVPPSGSGNISAFGGVPLNGLEAFAEDMRARRFPVPGTYRFHSTLFPSDTVTIVIASDR